MTTTQIQKKIEKYRSELRSLEMQLMLKQPHLTDVIDLMFLSVRGWTILRAMGVQTLEQLLNLREQDLHNFKHCGYKTINEIKTGLAEYGLALKK